MRFFMPIFLLLFSYTAQANFNISPLSQSISIKDKSASYTLENLTNKKAAYEIKVASRILDQNGKELRDETKEIRVFPSKVILEPQQKKRIKVIYLGKKGITQEKAFRVVFMQLDRDVTEQDQQTFNAKFNFHTAFYVTPVGAKSDLTAQITHENTKAQLTLVNQGNKHVILQDWNLKLATDSESQMYQHKLPDINMLASSRVIIPLEGVNTRFSQVDIVQE
ncbi:molecular chaperone [Vibrio sinensis]|uniref:Molecular chaperone n=1 Tax=Vibrio sinensis TaxID=2302434 RepID=A0A3A6QVI8_9VIBR|nr:fimbria/pilus periplasmic chaperone [Vibrio sinensis]RJX75308.1 molecular chaperone [Vibrio sinensis]